MVVMANELQNERGAMPVIFVVDDEPMLLELAKMTLQPAGYEVRTFEDPRHALADYVTAGPPPSLVITDYAMGSMNGLEVMRELRKVNPEQKIILISGTVDERIYANAETQPDCFFAKPYNPDELVAAVRALIGG